MVQLLRFLLRNAPDRVWLVFVYFFGERGTGTMKRPRGMKALCCCAPECAHNAVYHTPSSPRTTGCFPQQNQRPSHPLASTSVPSAPAIPPQIFRPSRGTAGKLPRRIPCQRPQRRTLDDRQRQARSKSLPLASAAGSVRSGRRRSPSSARSEGTSPPPPRPPLPRATNLRLRSEARLRHSPSGGNSTNSTTFPAQSPPGPTRTDDITRGFAARFEKWQRASASRRPPSRSGSAQRRYVLQGHRIKLRKRLDPTHRLAETQPLRIPDTLRHRLVAKRRLVRHADRRQHRVIARVRRSSRNPSYRLGDLRSTSAGRSSSSGKWCSIA